MGPSWWGRGAAAGPPGELLGGSGLRRAVVVCGWGCPRCPGAPLAGGCGAPDARTGSAGWGSGCGCLLCRAVAMPGLAFLPRLGNAGVFLPQKTAGVTTGTWLGSCSPPGPRCPSPPVHPPPRPLAPGAGAVAGRQEVMLPAALTLPRKPEFSFSFARWPGQSGAAPDPDTRHEPVPRSAQSRSHPLCSSPFLPARKYLAVPYSILSLRVCSLLPFLPCFCLKCHR